MKTSKLFFLTAGVIAGVVMATPVFALTISPVKLDLQGNPGQIISGEIQLFNEQAETKTFYSSFENFEASGETGAPHFIGNQGDLATWITTETQVTLNPGEQKKFPFSVTIPKDAEPGGHFAAIFWGTQQPSDKGGGQVSVGGKLGILVLLSVSGGDHEGGGLLDFGTKGNARFFDSLPVSFVYRIHNTGVDRIVPDGTIAIRNFFIIPSMNLSANPKKSSALPGSTRKFEAIWGDGLQNQSSNIFTGFFAAASRELFHPHMGWYVANMQIALAQDTSAASQTFMFFIIPWQLLLIVLIIASAGFLGIRKYNRWIIARARAH